MSRIAVIDGVTAALEEATVSVQDRGFLYGDSVFETLRTYGGAPYALERHLERLERSAALAHIRMPLARDAFAREILGAVRAAGNAESYIRVMVTRGSGALGLDPGLAGEPTRVVIVTPLETPPDAVYEAGIATCSFGVRRAADGTGAEGAKLGNYLVSVLAVRAAREAGASEALIVDAEGRIVEGATSNVFFVEGGTLLTPPEEAGILAGITRATVLDVARAEGISVAFGAPLKADLARHSEIFISSSIRELVAVVRVDGAQIGNGVPGPVYRRLLAAFRAKVRDSARGRP